MNASRIIARSIRFYWRTHLGVVLGVALATMVLTGSLLVGDSVKATLRRQAELRVGKADVAMTGGDRFFRAALADAVGAEAAPVLMLRAMVARADGGARVNAAQLLGVDARFWKLSPSGAAGDLPDDGVALNARLAQQLGVAAGDTVIVRVEKPGMFSKDAPLSGEENEVVAMRVKVARVAGDADYGRFALAASQVPPFTVFAPLTVVQGKVKMPGLVNLLLKKQPATASAYREPFLSKLNRFRTRRAVTTLLPDLRLVGDMDLRLPWPSAWGFGTPWDFSDASLKLLELPDNAGLELRTPRVFLDPPVVEAAPRGKDDRRVDALTYFVNELRAGERATPYSMVTAADAPSSGFLPAELADDEIVISQWLADDLGISTGAKVMLKYFVMGERRQLEEKTREFTVLAVLPMNEPQLNSSWMPDFPGLADKANCRDWKPGFEFDSTRMRDKDQQYWEQYRGTPKAFVNLRVGQQMWANRWGNLTSMRWPAGTDRGEIERELRAKLTPETLGFQFIPLREQALAATRAPVDFGELFLSFSVFLIAAAAVLTALLFVFSIEQRHEQAGTLLAVGWQPRQVRRLFLLEGMVLAVIGSILGTAGGLVYTKLMLRALATVWRGAVGAVEFVFAPQLATLVIGIVSGVAIAFVAMWLASRRQLRHSARELLAGETLEVGKARRAFPHRKTAAVREDGEGSASLPYQLIAGGGCAIAALALAVWGGGGAGAFFGAGALLLIAGLFAALGSLRGSAAGRAALERIAQIGVRNAARRRGRSMATIAVLASGVFIVVAVDSFRQRASKPTTERRSGTGGFALVGESALPIYDDLNTPKGREAFALDESTMRDVSVVPMRIREGDDASCLNLNRALQPRLLGVKPEELASRGAFRFSGVAWRPYGGVAPAKADASENVWKLLGQKTSDDITWVPAIADEATVRWALQKSLGDLLEFRDERGQAFKVVIVATLAGSVLQGNLLIDEQRFIEKFPSAGGYRYFLIDAPLDRGAPVAAELSRALQDRGLEVTPTWRRLAEFQTVENTYLSIFQVLGGLGLLLASVGLAIVVARNVLERRREFGLLEAVGFRPRQLRQLVFAEHRWLIVCGLVIGVASALLAVWPGLRERATGFPLVEMAILLAALTVGCVFWAWLATRLALRGSRIEALRSE